MQQVLEVLQDEAGALWAWQRWGQFAGGQVVGRVGEQPGLTQGAAAVTNLLNRV